MVGACSQHKERHLSSFSEHRAIKEDVFWEMRTSVYRFSTFQWYNLKMNWSHHFVSSLSAAHPWKNFQYHGSDLRDLLYSPWLGEEMCHQRSVHLWQM